MKQRPLFQLQNKYIVTATKSGLLVIDQHRAHQRILYEELVPIGAEGRSGSYAAIAFPYNH